MGRWLVALLVLGGLLFATAPAQAIPLAPGLSGVPTGAPPAPVPAGPILASVTTPVAAGAVSGIVTADVIADATNPFGAGLLTFRYQVTNTSATALTVRTTAINFAGFLTDIDYVSTGAPGPGPLLPGHPVPPLGAVVTPISVDRSPDGTTAGWTYDPPLGVIEGIDPGEASRILYVRTNASAFTSGMFFSIDGGVLAFPAFAPAAIPAPPSLVLALTGLPFLGLGYLRRRFWSKA